jgi:hypothetical protein
MQTYAEFEEAVEFGELDRFFRVSSYSTFSSISYTTTFV